MADKKRILIVTQEMKPYTSLTEMSEIVNQYAQYLQDQDMEVRILMPKFGTINERRHRLHEVVRLSGMNINVSGDDFPLIIKVASLPNTRMQVYFLDNEDFFKRKQVFEDADGNFFDDNLNRTIFFCKGVIETVKKFGWAPDVVHAHGWMLSLLPTMLKTTYANEPIFQESKMVYSSAPSTAANEAFAESFAEALKANDMEEAAEKFTKDKALKLNVGAAAYSDGVMVVKEDEDFSESKLDFEDEFTEKCLSFYKNLLAEAD